VDRVGRQRREQRLELAATFELGVQRSECGHLLDRPACGRFHSHLAGPSRSLIARARAPALAPLRLAARRPTFVGLPPRRAFALAYRSRSGSGLRSASPRCASADFRRPPCIAPRVVEARAVDPALLWIAATLLVALGV